jgi:hypothetical protein
MAGFRRAKKSRAAKVPKVPGATGRYPIKPRVAIFLRSIEIHITVRLSQKGFGVAVKHCQIVYDLLSPIIFFMTDKND